METEKAFAVYFIFVFTSFFLLCLFAFISTLDIKFNFDFFGKKKLKREIEYYKKTIISKEEEIEILKQRNNAYKKSLEEEINEHRQTRLQRNMIKEDFENYKIQRNNLRENVELMIKQIADLKEKNKRLNKTIEKLNDQIFNLQCELKEEKDKNQI